ncbi:DUF3224 domain-containing protein [Parvularcula dongshanensis]|uniref:DUF3224 domain-containing protein n=1 Tax=Parvularcula dongshanensis TaxID=1173995 RepID=A0A840I4I6_9PROT|nr:DUF3224 domain-containing protein [Parvularcula dongshanensis]MBB4659183.1 hypothetical protein [Parvularcula dongshanensis]
MDQARGTFSVSMEPVEENEGEGATLGRMTLSKTFEGDLAGRSEGQMLTAMTPVQGSAAYVAIERFEGSLGGRSGGFALSHRGVMSAAGQDLVIGIVPDSGSGDLSGIKGTMDIEVSGGQHAYTLDYDLP